MSSNKNKTPTNLSVPTAHNYIISIPLPKIKGAVKYFENVCQKLNSYRSTCSVQSECLSVTTNNLRVLTNIRKTVENEIKIFTECRKPPVKIVRHKNVSRITKQRRGCTKLLPFRGTPMRRRQDGQHSKHVNQGLLRNRRHWNKIKSTWKQWYISRMRLNPKFKAISKYFGQFIRRRHHEVSLYRQKKRSLREYRENKVLGKQRDHLKAIYVALGACKRKKHGNKTKSRLSVHKTMALQKSKLPFSNDDTDDTMIPQSKTDKRSDSAMIIADIWNVKFRLSSSSRVNHIPVENKRLVIRYYNQQVFVYSLSAGKNRPSKRNLVDAFSTLNWNKT